MVKLCFNIRFFYKWQHIENSFCDLFPCNLVVISASQENTCLHLIYVLKHFQYTIRKESLF